MTRSIAGALDMTALAALTGSDIGDAARMAHFHALDRKAQEDAIRRLAATGMSDYGISHATKLSVEMIRRVLAEEAA